MRLASVSFRSADKLPIKSVQSSKHERQTNYNGGVDLAQISLGRPGSYAVCVPGSTCQLQDRTRPAATCCRSQWLRAYNNRPSAQA